MDENRAQEIINADQSKAAERKMQYEVAVKRAEQIAPLYYPLIDLFHQLKKLLAKSGDTIKDKQQSIGYNGLVGRARQAVRSPCNLLNGWDDENRWMTDRQVWMDERLQKEQENKAKKENEALATEAIVYLLANDKHIVKHFSVSNAVDVANTLARRLEQERRIAEIKASGQMVSCPCEACNRWDGVSSQCDCGKTHVVWDAGIGHSFKNPVVCPRDLYKRE